MKGRSLLLKGLVWRVVNGRSIKIWSDSWLPRDGCRHPLGRRVDTNIELVSDLLVPDTRCWDEPKVRQVFYEIDAQDILAIKVGQ